MYPYPSQMESVGMHSVLSTPPVSLSTALSPEQACSRCSVETCQVTDWKDGQQGVSWLWERTAHLWVCYLVPTSSGNEGS